MYSFNNDYSEGAHPQIIQSVMNTNLIQQDGYSLDEHTSHAIKLIKTELQRQDVDIHFLSGGTQTNLIVISAILRPHQAVVTASTGHINVHETGAIEATGHKVLTALCDDGKLTPSLIQEILDLHTDEHMVQPKMVYISNSTEVGTIYLKSELELLSFYCKQNGLYLYMDGARIGSALCSPCNDLTFADIAQLVDAFYIGGTKNGALFGEALVMINPDLKQDLRFIIKQKGAMLAKGWLLGIQFEELFRDQLFFDLSRHANLMSAKLKDIIASHGYSFLFDSETNQLFPILPNQLIAILQKQFLFSTYIAIDDNWSAIRLVTSWATTSKAIKAFKTSLDQILN